MNLKIVIIIGVLILGTGIIVGTRGYLAHLSTSLSQKDAQSSTDELPEPLQENDIKVLVSKVGKHISVNTEEIPTVATVQDADVLRAQNPNFYKNAESGDRLVIWSDKAVLYSPSKDIILAVLPMSLPSKSTVASATEVADVATPEPTPTEKPPEPAVEIPTEKATIEVRNGSGIAGRGKAMTTKLAAAGLTVTATKDAKSRLGYEKTVIARVGNAPLPVTLQKLSELTGASIVDVPAAEGIISADILIIVGSDFTP